MCWSACEGFLIMQYWLGERCLLQPTWSCFRKFRVGLPVNIDCWLVCVQVFWTFQTWLACFSESIQKQEFSFISLSNRSLWGMSPLNNHKASGQVKLQKCWPSGYCREYTRLLWPSPCEPSSFCAGGWVSHTSSCRGTQISPEDCSWTARRPGQWEGSTERLHDCHQQPLSKCKVLQRPNRRQANLLEEFSMLWRCWNSACQTNWKAPAT